MVHCVAPPPPPVPTHIICGDPKGSGVPIGEKTDAGAFGGAEGEDVAAGDGYKNTDGATPSLCGGIDCPCDIGRKLPGGMPAAACGPMEEGGEAIINTSRPGRPPSTVIAPVPWSMGCMDIIIGAPEGGRLYAACAATGCGEVRKGDGMV